MHGGWKGACSARCSSGRPPVPSPAPSARFPRQPPSGIPRHLPALLPAAPGPRGCNPAAPPTLPPRARAGQHGAGGPTAVRDATAREVFLAKLIAQLSHMVADQAKDLANMAQVLARESPLTLEEEQQARQAQHAQHAQRAQQRWGQPSGDQEEEDEGAEEEGGEVSPF